VLPERASLGAHYQDEAISSRRTEEGRAIGTVVHAWLERIAADGLAAWSTDRVDSLSTRFMQQLSALGVPKARLRHCAATVVSCLTNTLNCDRGRWLLSDHPDAHCELAINGLVDGRQVRATIDRTFIDEAGMRWVVDYKTSCPARDVADQDTFLLEETTRYQDQLRVYLELVRNLHPAHGSRAALYFPMFGGWTVIDG
jgi:ATP-dependent exoDNAse (exonuclease V) beta subunit